VRSWRVYLRELNVCLVTRNYRALIAYDMGTSEQTAAGLGTDD